MPALEHAALAVTRWTGGPWAFIAACAVVLLWAVLGPVFGFSNSWQLVINTGTTIITFLMVFLIQRSQNKDTQAIELKLNELVAAIDGASNRLINVEDLDESGAQGPARSLPDPGAAVDERGEADPLTLDRAGRGAPPCENPRGSTRERVNREKEVDHGVHPSDQRRRPVRGRDQHPARAISGPGAQGDRG